ncbi:helix-turn-helix transcriptional regulator [Paenibacillus shenyangensis]|uniref:helix-turn-helix transcriptional regulator n=1 Tax=Paenibacillus sp. A9 TaxID=1284352 RepID=UPI00037790B0|nr:HTH domain-containing protein [Paenibacillus sp. A9]
MKSNQEPSTRRTIMMILKTRGPASVSDLAGELNITEMAVRRHIQALEQEGMLLAETVKIPTGRPYLRFRLSERAEEYFPHNYHQLAIDLLDELDEEDIARVFEGRKRKLLSRYQPLMEQQTLGERVATLTDIQQNSGYMASYEQTRPDEFTIYEFNCPINRVADQYNVACHCEQELFETLLGAKVTRTECIAKGGQCCVYRIQK